MGVTHGVEEKQSMQSTNSGISAEPVKKQAHTELEAACKPLSILHNFATSTSNWMYKKNKIFNSIMNYFR